jgi:hypothetical protein
MQGPTFWIRDRGPGDAARALLFGYGGLVPGRD